VSEGTPDIVPLKQILPLFNTMAIFNVQPGVSFHSVQEVPRCVAAALLLLYCCFTPSLLLLRQRAAWRLLALCAGSPALRCCCFTPAVLLLYCWLD